MGSRAWLCKASAQSLAGPYLRSWPGDPWGGNRGNQTEASFRSQCVGCFTLGQRQPDKPTPLTFKTLTLFSKGSLEGFLWHRCQTGTVSGTRGRHLGSLATLGHQEQSLGLPLKQAYDSSASHNCSIIRQNTLFTWLVGTSHHERSQVTDEASGRHSLGARPTSGIQALYVTTRHPWLWCPGRLLTLYDWAPAPTVCYHRAPALQHKVNTSGESICDFQLLPNSSHFPSEQNHFLRPLLIQVNLQWKFEQLPVSTSFGRALHYKLCPQMFQLHPLAGAAGPPRPCTVVCKVIKESSSFWAVAGTALKGNIPNEANKFTFQRQKLHATACD